MGNQFHLLVLFLDVVRIHAVNQRIVTIVMMVVALNVLTCHLVALDPQDQLGLQEEEEVEEQVIQDQLVTLDQLDILVTLDQLA
jgi:hypothetical protein